ncbi:MAG TPA: hypothetical protein VMZ24_06495 [Patescibacteria group bacterium]|nr:hypothetical protein [Patescibacteria group bacterium]
MDNRKTGTALSLLSLPVVILALAWILPKYLQAQEQNGIQVPASGDVVSGIVIIEGIAWDPDFLRYELAFYHESRSGAEWIVFAQGDQAVLNGTLAIWDTTVGLPNSPVFQDGQYRLRLRVVRSDYNYDEYYVSGLVVDNENTTPTPTTPVTATLESDVSPLSGTALAATARAEARPIPSLTPFPTPSPLALPENDPLGANSPEDATGDDQTGLFGRLTGIDTRQFSRAFWSGVRIAAFIFAGLAAYWLLRGIFRIIFRYIRASR